MSGENLVADEERARAPESEVSTGPPWAPVKLALTPAAWLLLRIILAALALLTALALLRGDVEGAYVPLAIIGGIVACFAIPIALIWLGRLTLPPIWRYLLRPPLRFVGRVIGAGALPVIEVGAFLFSLYWLIRFVKWAWAQ